MKEKPITFFDLEVETGSGKVRDFGATDHLGKKLHTNDSKKFLDYISKHEYLC